MALKDNLISYWKMEEASGNNRVDSHGSNDLTDGTTVAATTGIINNGADFNDADNEYLNITDGSQSGLDAMEDISISCWINPASFPSGNFDQKAMVAKYNATGNQRAYNFALRQDGTDTDGIAFQVSDDGTNIDTLVVGRTMSTATWYHVVVTFDGSTSTAKFYVDGSQTGGDQTGSNATSVFNNTADFEIGRGQSDNALCFDGIIDEVAIWSRVITSDEVSEIYNSGSGLGYDSWDVGAGGGRDSRSLNLLGVG